MQLGVLGPHPLGLPSGSLLPWNLAVFETIANSDGKSACTLELKNVIAGSASVLEPADLFDEQFCRIVPDFIPQ